MSNVGSRIAATGAAATLAIGGAPSSSRAQTSGQRQFRAYVCGQEQLQYLGAPAPRAVLGGTLGCAGSASIGAVLERGGFVGAFALDEAGTVGMAWYSAAPVRRPPAGAKLSPLVATGHLVYGRGTYASVNAKLTGAGRRLLEHSNRVALTVVGTFAPARKAVIRVTQRVILLEPAYQQCERFTQNVLATEYGWHVTQVVGISCRQAHRLLEALFVPGIAWPQSGNFLIGRWRCHSGTPPLFGTADVPVTCADRVHSVSAGWHIIKEP